MIIERRTGLQQSSVLTNELRRTPTIVNIPQDMIAGLAPPVLVFGKIFVLLQYHGVLSFVDSLFLLWRMTRSLLHD